MMQALEVKPPDDLAPVSELGFFSEDTAFGYWPIDPVVYLDTNGGRPDFLPDRFMHPADWITNWGIAALEVGLVIEHLERELTSGASFLKFLNDRRMAGKAPSDNDIHRSKTAQMMSARLPGMLTAMRAWRAIAASHPQTDPVDLVRLDDIFRMHGAGRRDAASQPEPHSPGEIRKTSRLGS